MIEAGPPLPPRRPDGAAFRGERSRDAARILPFAGLLLCTPPVVNLFLSPGTSVGVLPVAAYLFSVWTGLILCALRLSRALRHDRQLEPDPLEHGP